MGAVGEYALTPAPAAATAAGAATRARSGGRVGLA